MNGKEHKQVQIVFLGIALVAKQLGMEVFSPS